MNNCNCNDAILLFAEPAQGALKRIGGGQTL